MKILIITDRILTGLNYHRQLLPHAHLERNYNYEIVRYYSLDDVPEEELKTFQIVSFLRLIDFKDRVEEIVTRAKKYGAKVIVDIDDYWILHKEHELRERYEKTNYEKYCLQGLSLADYITTTTEHFADEISKINKNVVVLPNSIDPDEPQFKINPTENNRMRFGWIGGLFHVPDVAMMYEGIKDVYKNIKSDKFQFCLGGYNEPNDQYQFMELILKGGCNIPEGIDKQYRRLWGKAANEYATMYNDVDVCLVPLRENRFSSFKSQIKIIEAGYFNKPVIVSNVQPYTADCKKDNSILISPSKRNEGWGVAMKSLILNPNKGKDIAAKLNELVLSKYTMDVVNKKRHEFYQTLK
jgi:glycosyltransferase involved in cell wall biosynthesis